MNKKLILTISALMFFLVAVAFIIGKPPYRDKRIYPLVRQYTPYKIEKTLGGLRIVRKDNPKFKEEPDAMHFYQRLEALEREWAKKHLKLNDNNLQIVDNNGSIVKSIKLRNAKEINFVEKYYGVKPE